jgi:hypothetical protein
VEREGVAPYLMAPTEKQHDQDRLRHHRSRTGRSRNGILV